MKIKRKLVLKKSELCKNGNSKSPQFFLDLNIKNQLSFEDIEGFQKEDLEDKLNEINQETGKHKTKKKKLITALMFILNISIVAGILIYQIVNTEVEPISNLISVIKWQFIPVMFLMFFVVMFLDSFRTSVLLKQSTEKFQFKLAFKTIGIGRYWDSVTPMATGGQPFQVMYLKKHDIPTGTSISVPLARYVLYQISWLIITLFSTFYAAKHFPQTNLVSVMSYVGCIVNALLLFGTWFLSVSKKTGKILVAKILKLLQKIKIIKNYDKVYEKVMDTVTGFQTTMKMYTKKIFTFIGLTLTYVLQIVVTYSIIYIIYLLFGGTPGWTQWFMITIYGILIDIAAGFMPLPGGSGVAEVSFSIVYAGIFPNGTVLWAMLFWRFMNYYIYLIQGFILIIYDYIWGNKKLEWQKKKSQLELESKKFKDLNVKKYKNKKITGKIKI